MTEQESIKEQVSRVIEKIRPMLVADGGDIDLVDVVDGVVKVRLRGACVGCPAAAATLYGGVERMLMEEVEGVLRVEAVR